MSASSSGAMRGRPGEVRSVGAVKFAGNEPPVPGEDGIRFGDTGDLLKRSPAEPLADFSQGGSVTYLNSRTHLLSGMWNIYHKLTPLVNILTTRANGPNMALAKVAQDKPDKRSAAVLPRSEGF